MFNSCLFDGLSASPEIENGAGKRENIKSKQDIWKKKAKKQSS